MDEDEDSFLYGESAYPPPSAYVKPELNDIQPVSVEAQKQSNGVVAHLEAEVMAEEKDEAETEVEVEVEVEGEEEVDGSAEAEGDESDDDVEFIMEPTARSMDFRNQNQSRGPPRPPHPRTPAATSSQANNLTTEYTPRERGGPSIDAPQRTTSQSASQAQDNAIQQMPNAARQQSLEQSQSDVGPDPSTLPPVTAPPSHPAIDPSAPGTLDGRSIFDVDMANIAEKPWRRPGSDLSDWFNYGFDEISWEAYCYRRREMGEMATVLKTNVINFAGMPEDQLIALPPEVRTMVMTGATAMMAGGGPNPGMMAPGVGINPMMHDMSAMGPMSMGPMGMGMTGEMGMQMPPGGHMMQEGPGPTPGAVVGPGPSVTPEQGGAVQMNMQDAFGAGGPGPGMMGMAMGEFGIQDPNAISQQQMYPAMEGSMTPGPPARGGTPQFRGRGMAPGMGRGRAGGFAGRGRGRGGMFVGADGVPQQLPVRPASPLPPGVPTGPRNPGNRYKDRDNNAPAVDGLDYGGTNKDGSGGGTPSVESEEKSGGSRKRRASVSNEDERSSRSSKRR